MIHNTADRLIGSALIVAAVTGRVALPCKRASRVTQQPSSADGADSRKGGRLRAKHFNDPTCSAGTTCTSKKQPQDRTRARQNPDPPPRRSTAPHTAPSSPTQTQPNYDHRPTVRLICPRSNCANPQNPRIPPYQIPNLPLLPRALAPPLPSSSLPPGGVGPPAAISAISSFADVNPASRARSNQATAVERSRRVPIPSRWHLARLHMAAVSPASAAA